MSYLLTQIFICLLIAGLIGLIIGRLLSRLWYKKIITKNNEECNKEITALTDRYESAIATINNKLKQKEFTSKKIELDLREKLTNRNIEWEGEIKSLMTQKDNNEKELNALKTELLKIRAESDYRVQTITMQKDNLENKYINLKEELKKVKEEKNISSLKLSESYSKVQDLISQVNSKEKELNTLKVELLKVKADAKELNLKLNSVNSKLEEANNDKIELNALQEKLKNAENKFTLNNQEWESKLENIENRYKQEIELLNSDKEAIKSENIQKIEELKQKLQESESNSKLIEANLKKQIDECRDEKSKSTEVTEIKKDNLQLIKGIGEVLEKTLNEYNIYTFEQIASWSQEDVKRVSEELSFPGRIEREEWVKQAKILAKGEDTEFSRRVKKDEVPTSNIKLLPSKEEKEVPI